MTDDQPKFEPPTPQTPPSPHGAPAPYSAAPAYGAASSAPYGGGTPAAPERPKQVDIAFWLYVAAAVLGLIGLIISIASFGALRDETLRQLQEQGDGEVLPADAIDGIVAVAFIIGAVFAVVFSAAYIVLAIFARKGMNWARIVLTVLAGIAIFGILGGYGIGALQFLCLAAASVLVFLPASNQFFRSAGEARAAQRAVR